MNKSESELKRVNAVIYPIDDKFKLITSSENPKTPFISDSTLDSLGLWIWLLADDSKNRSSMLEKIRERFPDADDKSLNKSIDNLILDGLLIYSTKKTKTASDAEIAHINVYFTAGLVHSYKESYLVWFLSHIAGTISIVNDERSADIIFCNGIKNHSELENKLYVLVANNPSEDEELKFDYIFSTRAAKNSPQHLKWIRFPDNSIGTKLSLKKALKQKPNSGYAIKRTSKRFEQFLTGDEQNEKSITRIDVPKEPLLTIGMATHNDYDGVYFSLISLQIHHTEIFNKSEIIILDNDPEGKASELLKDLSDSIPNVRYVPYSDKNSTAVRDVLFTLARGEWVLCMDSHVLLANDVLNRLYGYMEKNPNCKDLLQGPLIGDSGEIFSGHFAEGWDNGMYGFFDWKDELASDINGEPYEIPMQGLGLFVCRKTMWPRFNKYFMGFGGEEGYIHQKFRNQGGKCLCLPFLRWAHRFGRPYETTYLASWTSRIQNYLIGFDEVGFDTQQVEDHFTELTSKRTVDQAKMNVSRILNSPFRVFDHIACINLDTSKKRWKKMQKRFKCLGIVERVQRFSAYSTPEYHHIGCALSHRKIIAGAKMFGYQNVLVFEDDALMLEGTGFILEHALEELKNVDWKILYLGAWRENKEMEAVENCTYIQKMPSNIGVSTHSIVYHESVYDELLAELPESEDEMAKWHITDFAIDQHLKSIDARYIISPSLFSQYDILEDEDERHQPYYR